MTSMKCATPWCGGTDPLKLYRSFTREELEREYSPSSCLGGDISALIERYVAESAEARRTCRVHEDLPYGEAPDEVLDLFLPQGPGPHPLHIFIHGGYWQELSHKASAAMAPGLGARGIALAVVNYTLAPDATIAEMIDQCARAIAWLQHHGADYGIDPDRISLSGHSAGAQLAAMVLSQGCEGIASALLISGIYDLEPLRHTYINEPLGLDAETARSMSPLFAADPPSCPVHVVVGENETSEFHRQSRTYAERLREEGRHVSHAVLEGLNHFDIILSDRIIEEIDGLA